MLGCSWKQKLHRSGIRNQPEMREWSKQSQLRCHTRVGWRHNTIWHHTMGYSWGGKDYKEKENFLRPWMMLPALGLFYMHTSSESSTFPGWVTTKSNYFKMSLALLLGSWKLLIFPLIFLSGNWAFILN